MCSIWLTQSPKHRSCFELKQIAVKIHHIDSKYKRQLWLIELVQLEEEYIDFVKQKSYNI